MHKHIVAGGTFDGLHAGHTHFLSQAFKHGARVTIGLTSARYIKRFKKGKGIRPYSQRYRLLTSWLRQEGYGPRAMIVPLHDPLGPAILPDEFDAIAVTADNMHVAKTINDERVSRGFVPLSIVPVDLLVGEDQKIISSTRLRGGEIDREGKLMMPDLLRPELQKPMGIVLKPQQVAYSVLHNRDNIIVTVGDVTTETIFSFGVQPALAVIDLQVERKPYQSFAAYKFPKKYLVKYLTSGPGFIAKKAVSVIRQWSKQVKKRTVLVVNGEEDLLAIPVIALAPLRSIVYYGQPAVGGQKEGLVEVVVTSEKKKQAKELLSQFS
jgi:pantetheine-phosphate adenylyltransferase